MTGRCVAKNATILVVDDDHDYAASLADVLATDEYRTFVAHDCDEAVKCFGQQPTDLTLMDFRLADRNGIDALLELRTLDQSARVVLMTGLNVEQLLDETLAPYTWGALHAPLDPHETAQLLRHLHPAGLILASEDADHFANLRAHVESAGYRVQYVHSVKQALSAVEEEAPDVLMLDAPRAIVEGLQVFHALRRENSELLVIIWSAYASQIAQISDRMLTMHTTGVLTKPFDPQQLLEKIDEMLNG